MDVKQLNRAAGSPPAAIQLNPSIMSMVSPLVSGPRSERPICGSKPLFKGVIVIWTVGQAGCFALSCVTQSQLHEDAATEIYQ